MWQAEIRQKLRTGRQSGRARETSSRAKRLSELRERAEKAQEKDGIQHEGEGLTAGEYFEQRERAREWVGLSTKVNSE